VTSPFDDVKKGESYFERDILCILYCSILCLDICVFWTCSSSFGHVVLICILGHVFGC